MSRQEVFKLDALEAFFDDVDFPCDRRDLITVARKKDASVPFVRALEELPRHQFKDVKEVQRFLNGELDVETMQERPERGAGPQP